MVNRRKQRIWEAEAAAIANRAASLGLPVDQPPAQGVEALRTSRYPTAGCLDQSVLNNPAIVAEIARALSCRMCAALVEVHHEMHEQRKNPLKLDFKPSAKWIRKLAAALKAIGLDAEPEDRMDEIRTNKGAQVVRHIEMQAHTSRSSNTECFAIITNGEFSKPFREIFDGSLMIPDTEMGKEVHKLLAQEFLAWMAQSGLELEIGHRVLQSLVLDNDSVIGYVVLEPPIPWPLPTFQGINCS